MEKLVFKFGNARLSHRVLVTPDLQSKAILPKSFITGQGGKASSGINSIHGREAERLVKGREACPDSTSWTVIGRTAKSSALDTNEQIGNRGHHRLESSDWQNQKGGSQSQLSGAVRLVNSLQLTRKRSHKGWRRIDHGRAFRKLAHQACFQAGHTTWLALDYARSKMLDSSSNRQSLCFTWQPGGLMFFFF